MAEIIIAPTEEKADVKIPEKLIFGRTFTTHLFEMTYDEELGGWQNPTIKKFSELSINPAALVFHYGQSIFEGLKAYKQDDGRIAIFRPEKNFERLNNSSKRMCIPEIDIDFVLNALKELISLDRDWIPTKPGHSLYIRPLVFAYDPFLGVRPGSKYKFFIMLSPVGPYYPEGFKPVPILASDKYVRAVRGGVGDCKTAGNYAASLLAQAEAKKEGFTQVLYLDALERKNLEEVGTMNIFVHFEDEVATPGLGGTILPGITRMSVLEILKDWGYNVNERNISIDEVIESYKNGKLKELFGTGTAAVISSVGRLKYKDFEGVFNNGEVGELGQKLYKELTDLHYGRKVDTRGWLTYID